MHESYLTCGPTENANPSGPTSQSLSQGLNSLTNTLNWSKAWGGGKETEAIYNFKQG